MPFYNGTRLQINSKRGCGSIYLVLILIYCIKSFTPVLSYYIPTIFFLGLECLWGCLVIIKIRGIPSSCTVQNMLIPIGVFVCQIIFYWIVGLSSAAIGNYFNQFSFFLCILMLLFVDKFFSTKQLKILFWLLCVIIWLNIISNIVLFNTYKILFDNIYQLDSSNFEGLNIGGTTFVTYILFFLCLNFLIVLYDNRTFIKLIFTISFILSGYYLIFVGRRGSVVILAIIAIVLMVFTKITANDRHKRVLGIIIISILGLFLILGGDFIMDFFAGIAPERLADRINDIRYTSQKGLSEDSFSGRYGLYIVSLNTWTNNIINFFIGIGDIRPAADDVGVYFFEKTGIGGHSELIDSLARYGVLGIILILCIYYRASKYIISMFLPEMQQQLLCILFTFFLCSIFKGVFFPEIGCMIFLVIPISAYIIQLNNKK